MQPQMSPSPYELGGFWFGRTDGPVFHSHGRNIVAMRKYRVIQTCFVKDNGTVVNWWQIMADPCTVLSFGCVSILLTGGTNHFNKFCIRCWLQVWQGASDVRNRLNKCPTCSLLRPKEAMLDLTDMFTKFRCLAETSRGEFFPCPDMIFNLHYREARRPHMFG